MQLTEETTVETTVTTEIGISEEILIIASESKGKSYSWTLVCCHNTTPTISALLPNPYAEYSVHNIDLIFDAPNVAITEVERLAVLANPTLEINIYEVFPALNYTDITYAQWGSFPILELAQKVIFASHDVNASISSALGSNPANPNTYNQSPTLNSSVVNS